MPRRPRCYLPDIPCHVVQRGNNRELCFFSEQDRVHYLDWLREASQKYGCAVHAYVLMTNHVHLLVTPQAHNGVSRMMQSVGRRYVQYVNFSHGRSGTLWEGRHKASLVDSERYLLTCHRYIEMNPVRAGIVGHPADYRWSSYRANAQGRRDPLIQHHPLYVGLGDLPASRQWAYRELFRHNLENSEIHSIRTAANLGVPLGTGRFKEQIDRQLKRRVSYLPRGRPRKNESQEPIPGGGNRLALPE